MTLSQEQLKQVQHALEKGGIKADVVKEVMNTLTSQSKGQDDKHGDGHNEGHGHNDGHGGGHGNGGGHGHGGGHGGVGGGHGDGDGHGGGVGAPSQSYDTIKGYCSNFKDAMMNLGTGIVNPDYEQEMMLVYMERTKLNNVLAITPNDGYVAAIMGVYDNSSSNPQVTISILGTDKNLAFVKDGAGNTLGGEQCWKEINILQNFTSVFE